MSATSSACTTVAKGGVGESGASSFVAHTVGRGSSKMMVVRNVHSNLCGNTGAVGVLTINGQPSDSGSITAVGSTLQAEAPAGSLVAVVVHTLPLFNGIICTRLGELSYTLSECELELAKQEHGGQLANADPEALSTAEWYAWNDLSPPKPDAFHITGEVNVANPGVDVSLVPKVPQGINPRILLLDLIFTQRPGIWPAMIVRKPVRYDKVNVTYDSVEIFLSGVNVATVPVDNIF